MIKKFFFYFTVLFPIFLGAQENQFKNYSKEAGINAILGDSFMIVITVIFAYLFSMFSFNSNIISLIILCYLIPYIIYTK